MGLDEAVNGGPPPRVRIFNLRSQESIEVQFNPTQFSEALSVNYERPSILGMSHKPLQYINTDNLQVPMEFFYIARTPEARELGQQSKNFLYSLCYPSRGAGSITAGQPPRALVVWPNVLSLTTKITQLNINNQRFNRRTGAVVQFTASCQFEEMRDVRWTSEDARELGVRRAGENPGGNQ